MYSGNTFACAPTIEVSQLNANKTNICKGDTVLFTSIFADFQGLAQADSIVWEFENGNPSHLLITTPSGARFDTSNWDNYKDVDDTIIKVVYNTVGRHDVKLSLYSSMDNYIYTNGAFVGGSSSDGIKDVAYLFNSDFINVINVSPAPFKDDLLCLYADSLINLNAGSTDNDYLWSNGSINNTALLDAGQHWVNITDSGCTVSDTFTILQSSITFDFDDTTGYCQVDGSVLLDATSLNGSYNWSDASSNATLNVSTEGFVWVEVTDLTTQCVFNDTTWVLEAPSILVDLGNDTCISSSSSLMLDAGNPGLTYLWSNGASSQTISTYTGLYTVEVWGKFGCETGMDTIFIDDCSNPKQSVGIETLESGEMISIYPNPIENIAEIKVAQSFQNSSFDLYNQMGQLVRTIYFNGNDKIYFDRQDLSAGIYIYTVQANNDKLIGKVILK